MKTKAEILKKYIHESKFLSCLSNEVGNLAIFKAMEEWGKQEYERGIDDGKIIAEHGTVNYQE